MSINNWEGVVSKYLPGFWLSSFLFITTSVMLFSSENIKERFYFELLSPAIRPLVGIVWFFSSILLLKQLLEYVVGGAMGSMRLRRRANKIYREGVSIQMYAVLRLLYQQRPYAERLLQEDRYVFRLRQLKLIRIPHSPIWFIDGSDYERFEITELGERVFELVSRRFISNAKDDQIALDYLNQVSDKAWEPTAESPRMV